jgi:predicted patatin/cPLA2 family phospholipase
MFHGSTRQIAKISVQYGLIALILCTHGCATYHSVPDDFAETSQVPGFKNIRTWGDHYKMDARKLGPTPLEQSLALSFKQEAAEGGHCTKDSINILALSGGGQDGAFGAGFLKGWTKAGTRPCFKVVTGISTGALMAPYAFLGSEYDDQLEYFYTHMTSKSLFRFNSTYLKNLMSALFPAPWPSLYDDQYLHKLIAKEADTTMIEKIAIEHKKGRRLLVGTTEINTQRLVIWDMGAIASSPAPMHEKRTLFHRILLASAAMPILLPPQPIVVEAGGKRYLEIHVDGGVATQVMVFEDAVKPDSELFNLKDKCGYLYVIRNQKVDPELKKLKSDLRDIANRSAYSLTKYQGIGDLYRIYTQNKGRQNFDYNLVYIPPKVALPKTEDLLSKSYMRQLFNIGYNMALSKCCWYKSPPGLHPNIAEEGDNHKMCAQKTAPCDDHMYDTFAKPQES